MKVVITEDCTSCGLCVDTCPEVFKMGDEFAELITETVTEEGYTCAQQAANECPVEAIIIS